VIIRLTVNYASYLVQRLLARFGDNSTTSRLHSEQLTIAAQYRRQHSHAHDSRLVSRTDMPLSRSFSLCLSICGIQPVLDCPPRRDVV